MKPEPESLKVLFLDIQNLSIQYENSNWEFKSRIQIENSISRWVTNEPELNELKEEMAVKEEHNLKPILMGFRWG